MKCLCYLGVLKEGFSPYSSPVILISQKVTQCMRVVTDFRHLNIRIAWKDSKKGIVECYYFLGVPQIHIKECPWD